jgi:hypothetical protein
VNLISKTFHNLSVFTEVWAKSKQLVLIISNKGIYRLFIVLALAAWTMNFGPEVLAQGGSEEPFVLSKRVGEDLDSVEIEYFNIFPELDFIKSAVYRKDNFGNILFLLSNANGKDTTITISRLAGLELRTLLDRFEDVPDSNKLVNWRLLPGFDASKLNYFENVGRNVTVYSSHGNFSGRLLMASDSAISIWIRRGDFLPDDCSRYIKRFHFSAISAIEVKPSFSTKLFGASIGAGLALAAIQLGLNITNKDDYLFSGNSVFLLGIGGLAGAIGGFFFDGISTIGRYKEIDGDFLKFRKVREKIRAHAMFDKVYPPELKQYR